MVGVPMPGEETLPPSPTRDLVAALHELYELAGKPACRTISRIIRERDDLPGTLSHEGVSAALRGVNGSIPRWANLESLVRVLAETAITKPSVDAEVVRIHSLWRVAARVPVGSKGGAEVSSSQINYGMPTSAINSQSARPALPLASWDHPRLGRFEFFDRELTPEVIREVGKLDE
jgi:hypothetical protein